MTPSMLCPKTPLALLFTHATYASTLLAILTQIGKKARLTIRELHNFTFHHVCHVLILPETLRGRSSNLCFSAHHHKSYAWQLDLGELDYGTWHMSCGDIRRKAVHLFIIQANFEEVFQPLNRTAIIDGYLVYVSRIPTPSLHHKKDNLKLV